MGGAWRTISVDAAVVALERGRENMRAAGVLDTAQHEFAAEDAFTWLTRAAKKGERHDLVLLDPPSYSSTKKRRFVADSDYAELASLAIGILRNGGNFSRARTTAGFLTRNSDGCCSTPGGSPSARSPRSKISRFRSTIHRRSVRAALKSMLVTLAR